MTFNVSDAGWTLTDIANKADQICTNETCPVRVWDENSYHYFDLSYLGLHINNIEKTYIVYDTLNEFVNNLTDKYYFDYTGSIPRYTKEVIDYFTKHGYGIEYEFYINAIHPVTTLTKADMEWAEDSIDTEMPVMINEKDNLFIGEEPIELVNIVQDKSVILEAPEGINSTYTLKVEDILKDATSETIEKVEEKTNKALLALYEINVLDKDNEVVGITEGTYKIRIKLSETLLKTYENFKVVYIDEEGNIEELDTTLKDEYVEFSTTHLSKYGIVGTVKKTQANETTTKQAIIPVTNPNTLDNMYINVVAFITLGFVGYIAFRRVRKLRRN